MTTPSASLQTISVNNVNPGTLLVQQGDGPTLIGNTDLSTILWLSRNVSVIAARPQDAIALPPQSTIVVDGTDNVYGITAGPTITVTLAPGGTGFFQNVNLPASVGTVPAFNANTSWGPFTFNFAGASAYSLALTPNVAANCAATDVTIQHLDSAGNILLQEFFGAIPCGSWPADGTSIVTIIRGNLYGTQLRISGQSISQAFLNAVITPNVATITGVSINVTSLPRALSAGAQRLLGSYVGVQNLTTGVVYTNQQGTSQGVPPGATVNMGTAQPCQGPAIVDFRFTGALSTPINARVILNFYSMAMWIATANTLTPIMVMRIMSPTIGLETFTPINLPAALCQVQLANIDATTTATCFCNIVASNQV